MTDDTRALFEALDRTVNGATIRFAGPVTISEMCREVRRLGLDDVWLAYKDWEQLYNLLAPSSRYGISNGCQVSLTIDATNVWWFSD